MIMDIGSPKWLTIGSSAGDSSPNLVFGCWERYSLERVRVRMVKLWTRGSPASFCCRLAPFSSKEFLKGCLHTFGE